MVYYPSIWTGSGCEAGEFCGWDSGWGAMIAMSILVVIFIYAIVYMLSYFINSEELKRSAKAHFVDALATAFLAAAIVGILTAFFLFLGSTSTNDPNQPPGYFFGATVTCGNYGTIDLTGGEGPYQVIKCRLQEKAKFVSDLYERVYYSAREPMKRLSAMYGIAGFPIYMGGSYVWQTAISDLYTRVENYRLLAHVCVALLMGINGYIGAVDYVYNNMLRMFLPIGIVLRAIPPTRNIGAFFIALAIGFYVVFPILFVVTDPNYVKAPDTYVDITSTDQISLPWPSFGGVVSLLTMGPQTDTASSTFGAMDAAQAASQLGAMYYAILLQPVVILSITLVFVRYLANLFGGEAQELFRLASKVI